MKTRDKNKVWFQLAGGIRCILARPDLTITSREVVEKVYPIAASKICRFGAQLDSFYSLAQHVIGCANWVEGKGGKTWEVLQALLHDGGEAFLGGDIPAPVRWFMSEEYEELEDTFMRRISEVYQIPHALSPLVKEADLVMRVLEAESFLEGGPIDNWTATHVDGHGIDIITELKNCRMFTLDRGPYSRIDPWGMEKSQDTLSRRLKDTSFKHLVQCLDAQQKVYLA